jgi:PAS domain S-box-containing protein
MSGIEKTPEEFMNELEDLQLKYNSMKELYQEEISGLRQEAEKVKKSEEKFRIAYMTSPDSININRLSDGMYVSINEGFTGIMGFSEEDAIGRTSLELNIWVNPEDRMNLVKELEANGKVKNFETKFRSKNGTVVNGLLAASLINLDGVPHILTVVRDITIRKQNELESYALFEIVKGITSTDNLDELLKLIHHSLGKVVYAENCFVALFNQDTGLFSFPYFVDKVDKTPLPASMGKSCTDYVFRTVKPLLLTQQIFDTLVEQNEVELVGSNSPSWIGIPLQTPSKVIGVLVLQHYENENVYSENDVKFLISIGSQIAMAIERKKAEEEISLKNELLQAINAEKDKFFSIIAHDLRGPLSSFVAATQILTEEIQTMGIEEIKKISMSMKTSASNIYSLLENLLEWSRLRRGGLDFVQEKLNLMKDVKECIDVLSESARKKDIEISVSIPEKIEVLADKHMLDTVIRNLVSNALKFTPVGGKVCISADYTDGHYIEVKVKDSGIGMTTELKNKLFIINEKTSRNGTEGELSSGLGLLLCKEFIEKHDGKIWVESETGMGSIFSFTIGQSEI